MSAGTPSSVVDRLLGIFPTMASGFRSPKLPHAGPPANEGVHKSIGKKCPHPHPTTHLNIFLNQSRFSGLPFWGQVLEAS